MDAVRIASRCVGAFVRHQVVLGLSTLQPSENPALAEIMLLTP
jgi:hypothetical protein